jgi:DNA-binding LacI/PurR family transcriptional regulator
MNSTYKKDAHKKMNISDIAKALELSTTTISRAISGKGRIGEATRERVWAYIRENDYRPNIIAKSLAQSKTFNIGVVLPADQNLTETPFFQKCLLGITEMAASNDYDVVVTTTTETDITLLQRIVENHKVDGVVLTRTLVNDFPAKYLEEKNIPFVAIGTTDDEKVIQIDNNHRSGCKELTTLLLNSGMQSIGLLCGDQNHVVNQERYQGYIEAFRDKELPIKEELIFSNVTNKAFVEKAVESLMEDHVECILCMDDLICSRAIYKLMEDHVSIPNQVKVASFYNSAFLESHNPQITALDFDVKEVGAVAAKNLMELISGKEVQKKTLLDYSIILKASTK